MKILLVSGMSNTNGRFGTSLALTLLAIMLLLLAAAAVGGWYGYQYALEQANLASTQQNALVTARQLQQQQTELEQTRARTRDHLDALAKRLGELQSHLVRLDALGSRLTDLANLDEEEFDFEGLPPQGGSSESGFSHTIAAEELEEELKKVELAILDRDHKLSLLEELLMNHKLLKQVVPSGAPVEGGWISSDFGYRQDPFTGKRAMHEGVDIAGHRGADIFAVASGVVTFAGYKSEYGNLVEIRHGNGYVTRYGHCKSVLTNAGDIVVKGDTIATMGSSGRSTGPHVHFEVALSGEVVDPMAYLKTLN